MFEPIQKATADFQKLSKDNYDAVVRSYGELNKGFQAIGARVTDYSKQAFNDATRTFEKLVGAKSLEHAVEIQSQYAKRRSTPGSPKLRRSMRCTPLSRATPTSPSSKRWRRTHPR
ncbi:MAG: phasin family protein [Hyphomicrobiales bacterium]